MSVDYLAQLRSTKAHRLFRTTLEKTGRNSNYGETRVNTLGDEFPEYNLEEIFLSQTISPSTGTVSRGSGPIDFTKDGEGKTIIRGHPLFPVVQASKEYDEGKEFEESMLEVGIRDYFTPNQELVKQFKPKGVHFINGYLDKYTQDEDELDFIITPTFLFFQKAVYQPYILAASQAKYELKNS